MLVLGHISGTYSLASAAWWF